MWETGKSTCAVRTTKWLFVVCEVYGAGVELDDDGDSVSVGRH